MTPKQQEAADNLRRIHAGKEDPFVVYDITDDGSEEAESFVDAAIMADYRELYLAEHHADEKLAARDAEIARLKEANRG